MYRIPNDFDISGVVGQCTTQLCLGQYDLQFSIGEVRFYIWSPIVLRKQGSDIGRWQEDTWPSQAFFEILNVNVVRYEVSNERQLVIHFENGIEMHLADNSDQYESMQINGYII